jgi:hypothetical protein
MSPSQAKPKLWWIQSQNPTRYLPLKQSPSFDESKGNPSISLSSKAQALMNPKANPSISLSRAKPKLWWIQRQKPKHLSLKQSPTFDESKGKPPRISLASKGQLLMNPKANPNYISLSNKGQSLMNPRHETQVSCSQVSYSQSLTNSKPKYLALLCSFFSFAPCCIVSLLIWWRLEGFAPCMNECYVCMTKELESFGWGVSNNAIGGNLSENL